jgi:hypothetical protein
MMQGSHDVKSVTPPCPSVKAGRRPGERDRDCLGMEHRVAARHGEVHADADDLACGVKPDRSAERAARPARDIFAREMAMAKRMQARVGGRRGRQATWRQPGGQPDLGLCHNADGIQRAP